VTSLEGDVLKLQGPVTLFTVPELLAGTGTNSGAGLRRVDLAGVTEVDSSAVALALELCRRARAAGSTLEFENVPDAMRNLARLYGVSEVLGIGE
jgi:phospholipid transport system transporter-binding protein